MIRFSPLFYLIAITSIVGGLGIIGYQCYSWLRLGEWPPMPLALALVPFAPLLGDFEIHWVGISGIVEWILLEVPLSIVMIAVGFGANMAAELLSDREDTREAARRRRKHESQ